jgi:chlorophyll synthase
LTLGLVSEAGQAGRRLPTLTALARLLKPVTWFPPMWAFGCGVVASGGSASRNWPLVAAGLLVTGPLVCGASQAVNDWFDRDVDALNEPARPIPSGAVPGRSGLYFAVAWTALSLAVGAVLGPVGLAAVALALALGWAYSAPPLRLKQNGWWGNAAVALAYEGLAWVTGAALLAGGQPIPGASLLFAALYSAGAHGIMTLNDFKSIEGDTIMGVGSLPVRLGVRGAALVACGAIAGAQLLAVAALVGFGQVGHAAAVAALVVVQLGMMRRFVADPRRHALWLSAAGVPFYVAGMMVAASAVRALAGTGS